ncbi:hypothetical protein NJ76_22960 [Rhodococcus sp. IITR03]|nr:hypothetical protein NJ76_22960 [Rhodococcus sp. IITR03]
MATRRLMPSGCRKVPTFKRPEITMPDLMPRISDVHPGRTSTRVIAEIGISIAARRTRKASHREKDRWRVALSYVVSAMTSDLPSTVNWLQH